MDRIRPGSHGIGAAELALVTQRFPEHRITGATRLHRPVGKSLLVARLEAQGTELQVVLKPFGARDSERAALRIEQGCLRECERLAIEAPRVLGSDSRAGLLLLSAVRGETLRARLGDAGESEKDELRATLGRFLGLVHRRLDPKRLPTLAVRSTRDLVTVARSNLCSLSLSAELELLAVLDRLEPHIPEAETLVVCHGDLSDSNVLLNRQDRPALLDWSDAQVAAAATDVAFLTSEVNGLCTSPAQVEQVVTAYRQTAQTPLEALDLHRALDYLTQAINAASQGLAFEWFLERSSANAMLATQKARAQ